MLKSFRIQPPYADDISWSFNTVAERGGIASIVTTDSGAVMGSTKNVAGYVADPANAKPLGILTQDVVDYDTNRQHENWEKGGFQQRKGSKVCLNSAGKWSTNMVNGNPTAGATAYLAASGFISPTQASNAPPVGKFLSTKDADGYVLFQPVL